MAHLGLMAAAGSIIYFVICCFALFRGEPPERLVAATMLIEFIVVPLVYDRRDYATSLPVLISCDTLVLIVLLGAVFRWRRAWLTFGAASQACSVLVTWARLTEPSISRWIYVSAGVIASYGLLLALAAAGIVRLTRTTT